MQKSPVKIKKVSAVDAIENYLKAQIEEGALKPGEQLPSERALQEILGVSRFTLREALARLSALGIISIAHGKGAFVAEEMSPASLEDVFLPLFANRHDKNVSDFFEARMIIESEVVRLCARRRKAHDLKRLNDIIEQSEGAIEDPVRFAELDFLFHREISRIAGNVFLDKMMGCLNEYIKKYLLFLAQQPQNRKRSHVNHQHILKMITKKDVENAGEVTYRHLKRTFKTFSSMK